MKINTFVISLKEDQHRRKYFRESNRNLTFTFFDAIDLRKNKIPFNKINFKYFNNKDFSKGALGCLLSHRKLLKLFLKSSDEYLTILEDDVYVDTKKYFTIICNINKINDFDLLFLGANNKLSYPIINTRIKFFDKLIIADPVIETLYCSYGYIVSRKGAKILLKSTRMGIPIDYWGSYNNINYKVVYPNIVTPNVLSINSSISFDKKINKITNVKWIIYLIYYNLKNLFKNGK